MHRLGWVLAAFALAAAGLAVWWERRQTRRTLDRLEQLLDQAHSGTIVEQHFDESRLCSLETRFANYLRASAVSAQSLCEEKDKIKTMISDISHQTKTPIANLLLYAELLKEEPLPPPAQAKVEALHLQAQKLHFLIDALVKLSRLESGIITLSPRHQAVEPLLRRTAEQFRPRAQEKGLVLRVEEGGGFAVFDLKWTAEALGNLVDNAIKYTQEGTVTLCAAEYELFVRIDVCDSGIGISGDEAAKLFTRFYRGEAAREQEGLGIGLYLARQIVREEGGYMKAAPQEHGSVFSIFLPR